MCLSFDSAYISSESTEHMLLNMIDMTLTDTDEHCSFKAKQCQSSAAQGCLLLKKKCSGASHVGGGHGGACHLHIKVSQPQVQDRDSGRHHLCSTTAACDCLSHFMSLPLDWPQNCLSHFMSLPIDWAQIAHEYHRFAFCLLQKAARQTSTR